MHEHKFLKHLFILDEAYFAFIAFLCLLTAVFVHELGHYAAAFYYGLNPTFGISPNAIYVKTDFLDFRLHEIVNHSGPILNLIVASFALIFLYIRGHTCDINDYLYSVLFLLPMTNMLVALFSLILFAFSGLL